MSLCCRKELVALKTSVAAVITHPPEILTCIKFLISNEPIFLIFHSHLRPSHPDGAGFILSTSVDAMAPQLASLLAVDPRLLVDNTLQWQVQLLAQFAGHVFVSRAQGDTPDYLVHVSLESSLAMRKCEPGYWSWNLRTGFYQPRING